MPRRTFGLDLLQLCTAIPNLQNAHRAIQVNPIVRARKRVQKAANVGFLSTDIEIEIVLSVPQFARLCDSGVRATARAGVSDESRQPPSRLESRILLVFCADQYKQRAFNYAE